MNPAPQRRYPGLNYFKETQRAQFFGRDDEIEELYALILTEKIVTLFGKSGYGKSSLIRAGILPQIPSDFTPLIVQLGAYQPGISPTPIARTMEQLHLALAEDNPASAFLGEISDPNTLWHQFKRKQSPERKQFLLVFDQFEEFDSYPSEQKTEFKQQLAELLFTRIPQSVRDQSDTLPDAQQALLAKALEVKAVFTIREDRLSVLDSLADKLPAILHKRFKLQGLTQKQALRAIEGPAQLPQEGQFISTQFTYTKEALQDILSGLEKKVALASASQEQENARTLPEGRLEAFLLQICCESIESSVVERQRSGQQNIMVSPNDLPPFDRLFEEYYRSKIATLPAADQEPARRMIEDELVKADAATGIAYRMSGDGRRLRALPGITEALLKRLTDDFLLRSEPNTTHGFNYEVSHDTLVEGILKSKTEYEAAQAIAAAEQQAQAVAEQLRVEAAERERQLVEQRQKLAQARRRNAYFALLALAAIVASILAFRQGQIAEAEKRNAEIALDSARVAQNRAETALDSARVAQNRAEMARSLADTAQARAERSALEAREATLRVEVQKEQVIKALNETKRSAVALKVAERAKLVTEIMQLLNEATVFERAGEWPNAEIRLLEVLRLDPDNREAIRRLNK